MPTPETAIDSLCRDCLWSGQTDRAARPRCPACGGLRLLRHDELNSLSLAHMDCDAFFASVEKRDDPSLRDKPVIVGGGQRGVVSTACYIARQYGVRSAMPMGQALRLCPQAVVIRPSRKYSLDSRKILGALAELTPLIQAVSIDEAWVDLSGTERLNGGSAAFQLARFQKQILESTGLTVSIGLAPNKFLAKMASDMDKPHGFFIIGRAEAKRFLADKPVGLLPGVGKASVKALARYGYGTIGDLAAANPRELIKHFGDYGYRLYQLSQAEDPRPVRPERERKGMSHETTFARDLRDLAALEDALWPLCETLAAEMRQKGFSARVLILKLRRADFQLLTRRRTLAFPTQTARTLFQEARTLLARELKQTPGQAYRLIGIGVADLHDSLEGASDLFAADETRALKAEQALDALRARFGSGAIQTGRSFRTEQRIKPPSSPNGSQEP